MPFKSRKKLRAYLKRWRLNHPAYSRDYMRGYNEFKKPRKSDTDTSIGLTGAIIPTIPASHGKDSISRVAATSNGCIDQAAREGVGMVAGAGC